MAAAFQPALRAQTTPVITWTAPDPITYGTPLSSAQLDATSSVPGTFTYVPDAPVVLAAGTYQLSVTLTPSDTVDYTTATASVTFVVNQAPLTVTANNASFFYGASLPTLNVTFSGFVIGDPRKVVTGVPALSTAATPASGIGTYPITVTQGTLSAANYTFVFVNGTLTEKQATPVITWPTPAPITFGTPLSGTQLDATTPVPGTFTYTPHDPTVLLAGTHQLSVVFTPSDAVDYKTVTTPVTLVVNPATLTVTAANASCLYQAALPNFTVSYSGFVNGNTKSVLGGAPVLTTTAAQGSPAGAYPITVTQGSLSAANYIFVLISGTLSVNQLTPVVTWSPPDPIAYGTPLSGTQLDATANLPGTFIYTPHSPTVLNAGTIRLSVTFTPDDSVDYKAVTATTALVINQSPLVVTANNITCAYGSVLPALTWSVTGYVNKTSPVTGVPSLTTTATSSSPIGAYPITIAQGTLSSSNYYFSSFGSGTLIVIQGTPVITWPTPAPVTYGTPLSGTQLTATTPVPGTFIYTPHAPTVLLAGTHQLSVTFTPSDTVDYKTQTASATLVVNPATLTVTAANASCLYQAVLPAFTVSYSGFVNGNTKSILSGAPVLTTPAAQGSAAGAYPITVAQGTLSAPNYTFVLIGGTLTVNQATPVITWPAPAPITYGTPLSSAQLDATGSVSGSFTYVPHSPTVLNAGTSHLYVTFTPDDAVDFKTVTASVFLVINQAPLLVAANNLTCGYGTGLPALTYSISGYVNNNPVSGAPSLTTTATSCSPIGTYPIAISQGTLSSSNYYFSLINGMLTVSQATPVITWPPSPPISYGTVLSSAQLNASASVPGLFVYAQPPGYLPSPGTQTLSATFTPTDNVDYVSVTATNQLIVESSPPSLSTSIQHVIVIMQENRSFDNLFNGFPGADTVQSGNSYGTTVALQPVPMEYGSDVDHSYTGWVKDWDNGAMDGFGHSASKLIYPEPNYPFGYVPQSETVPIWTLAQQYTLGDRMFQSNTGPSFAAHQYMIAGQAADTVGVPVGSASPPIWGCDAPADTLVAILGPNGTVLPGVFPCFTYETLADEMDAANVSWRYYAAPVGNGGVWSAFDAISQIRYSSDWANNVISPGPQVLTDIQNGLLAQVTWITPDVTFSDHPGPKTTMAGPSWVADIVNAVGQSQYWYSTVILVSWDDWGGWYDHVPPPQIDNMGLGFRVPLLVISPWSKHGYVSHQQHEFGSFLHMTEEVFNLPSLGTRDAISDDLSDCFDFTQTPQPYVQVPTSYPPAYFITYVPGGQPPDDD